MLVGAARTSEAVVASVVARFLLLNAAERETLNLFLRPVLHIWNGGFEAGPLGSPRQSKVASTLQFFFIFRTIR
jgi:hypothetical protein